MHLRVRSRGTRPPGPGRTAAALALAAVLTAAPAAPAGAAEPAPGDLVSAEASAFRPRPGQPSDTRAWKIRYRSTTATGAPNTVSGTVVVPEEGRPGPRPLVAYAVGTVGLDDSCAPGAAIPRGTLAEAKLVRSLLRRGWAVVVTDYEGLGTPGEHTYTVGRSAGHAVLDAARAALDLPGAGLSDDSPVGVMGYSQGGQAAGWAAELHDSYAPGLNLKGTAAGGVPGDLEKAAAFNDGSHGSGLILMALSGQDAAFPELRLDSYLNPAGKALVGFLRRNCVLIGSATGSFKRISDLTVRDPLGQPDWRRRLRESAVGTHRPDRPVYLYHAFADELIPYGIGRQVRADWCGRGAVVRWRTIMLGDHSDGAFGGAPGAADWLADRFADRPAPSDC